MLALPSEVMMAVLKSFVPPEVQTTNATLDWHGVIGSKNTSPDNHIVIYDTTGVEQGRVMATGEYLISEGIQILVRGKTYPVGARKIKAIEAKLAEVKNLEVTVGVETITVLSLTLSSRWTFAGNEEQNARKLFTTNWRMALRG